MYVSSSSPIPQNGAIAPPPDLAGDLRRYNNAMYSRLGRERAYATLPTPASLAYLGLGLAVDAAQMISASESAREAVLIGVGNSTADDVGGSGLSSQLSTTLQNLQQILTQSPTVYSLNGSTQILPAGGIANPTVLSTGQGSVMAPTMPKSAPVPVGGVFMGSQRPAGPMRQDSAPVMRPPRNGGGPPSCGLTGYPPPWSNAYVTLPASSGGFGTQYGGVLGWIQQNPLLAAGLAIAGGAMLYHGKKRRGRR